MPLRQALQIAKERDIDLVEVAPTATPPVCRLLDYGKFKYEQAKKEREARKRQKGFELRQVRLRPKTSEHDIEAKTRLVKRLLAEGSKVKVLVIFRGREVTHLQIGKRLLERVSEALQETANIERPPMMEGRNMSMVLSPDKRFKGGKGKGT
jgi:translation initiation factor IF-3